MSFRENINSSKAVSILTNTKISAYIWIASFAIMTAVAAQIAIPVKPVPFTLQTMMVVLAGAFLGAKNGAYSQVLYLALGAVGLPVFAQVPDGAMGFARLFGPTGGYLLAFPLGAFLAGYIIEKDQKYLTVVLAMFASNILIIFTGTLYLYTFYLHDFSAALASGAAIFSIWSVIKMFAAASIYFGVSKIKPNN